MPTSVPLSGVTLLSRWWPQLPGLKTLVVSSDTDVRGWADHLRLSVIDDPGSLDKAAHDGRAWFAASRMQSGRDRARRFAVRVGNLRGRGA